MQCFIVLLPCTAPLRWFIELHCTVALHCFYCTDSLHCFIALLHCTDFIAEVGGRTSRACETTVRDLVWH